MVGESLNQKGVYPNRKKEALSNKKIPEKEEYTEVPFPAFKR